MPFLMPDLIVSSIILDGIADIQANPTILDDVFGNLLLSHNTQYFGAAEITKLKTFFTGASKTHIAVVNSFVEAAAKSPSISVQLGANSDNIGHAHLGDYEEDVDLPLTTAELNALIKVTNLIPTSYDPLTGKVKVLDAVDLSAVSKGFLYKDGAGVDHTLLTGISNTLGDKFFFIAKTSTVDIVNPGTIRSFLTNRVVEGHGVLQNVSVILGIFTKNALLTMYLANLVHFWLLSRKEDLINRGMIDTVVSGSDFTRDQEYGGDMVFTRFLTIAGEVAHTWDSTMFSLVDTVNITTIPKDC